MSWEVRACGSLEELRAALAPIFHVFGRSPTDETAEHFAPVLPPDRMYAAREGETFVGGAGSFPFELTVPRGRGEQTKAEPELRLDVRELGSVYLGGFTFAQLQRAGRVEEVVPGAIPRADALFATDRAPWCPEIF